MRWLPLVLIATLILKPASAATYCVIAGDTDGLNSAMWGAVSNGEDDIVHLQSGEYSLSSDLVHLSQEAHSLTIDGGYSEFFGDPCGLTPVTPDASQTRISGNSLARVSFDPHGGSLTIKNLTIAEAFPGAQSYAAVQLVSGENIAISNLIVTDNTALNAEAVRIWGSGGILIQNSLFAKNATWAGLDSITVNNDGIGSSICCELVNLTLADNVSSFGALYVESQDPNSIALIANSIFWGNGGHDLDAAAHAYLLNDDIGTLFGNIELVESSVVIDPLFKDSSNGDYSLRDDSPVRDAGSAGGGFIWGPGDWDVVGNPRVYGASPDMGAFEVQDVIFASGMDVQVQ